MQIFANLGIMNVVLLSFSKKKGEKGKFEYTKTIGTPTGKRAFLHGMNVSFRVPA